MAGAFGQMKELFKMQREAKQMQKKMKAISILGLSDDELVVVKLNGVQDIEEIEIADELMSIDRKRDLQRNIKQAMKDAQKKLQKEMAKDFDINSLKSMFN